MHSQDEFLRYSRCLLLPSGKRKADAFEDCPQNEGLLEYLLSRHRGDVESAKLDLVMTISGGRGVKGRRLERKKLRRLETELGGSTEVSWRRRYDIMHPNHCTIYNEPIAAPHPSKTMTSTSTPPNASITSSTPNSKPMTPWHNSWIQPPNNPFSSSTRNSTTNQVSPLTNSMPSSKPH